MKRFVWILMLTMAQTLVAQLPGDSGSAAPDGAQARDLRKRIRQRWNEHVRSTLARSGGRCRGGDRAAECGSERGRSEPRRATTGRVPENRPPAPRALREAQLSTLLSCSQRPSSVGSPSSVPSASVKPAKIHGLPPTPPSTGCFGKVKFRPAGMTVTLRVTSASCGPPTGLSLLRKMIRADMPAMVTPLVKLMYGPGLFSQPVTVNVAYAEAVVTADWVTCQPAPWTQRPTKISSLSAAPLAPTNCTQMNGLPPAPPSTGCFGITICSSAGMTVTSTVWPSV